jgi:hypothetical protein
MTPGQVDARTDRRSLGGRVVEDGLTGVGYRLPPPRRVALVETARPGRTPYDVVLAQNAWNVIGGSELRTRLSDYPRRTWARFLARRAVTRVNLRRAHTVVCLTVAMGDLCRTKARRIVVAPVTVPLDFLETAGGGPELETGTLLVPGTVAPYKDPRAALDLFRAQQERLGLTRVLFAGGDDGSGCWPAVEAEAGRLGVPCERRLLGRAEMRAACVSAAAIVVPSRMESLSFSLAEALLLGREVWASRIPAHVELAARLGREPLWLGEGGRPAIQPPPPAIDTRRFTDEWVQLGERLGLQRTRAVDGGE